MSTSRKPKGAAPSKTAAPQAPVEVCLVIKGYPALPVTLTVCKARSADIILVPAGEMVFLPPGKYAVIGAWSPNWDGRVFGGGFVYTNPPLTIDCTVTIPQDGGLVEVEPRLDCFCLSLGEGCEKYRIRGYDGAMMDLPWMRGGRCYLQGQWAFPPLTVTAIEKDSQHTYELVTAPSDDAPDAVLVEYGQTYVLSAN